MALKICTCGKKVGPNTRKCNNCGYDFFKNFIGLVPEEDYEENIISEEKAREKKNCVKCDEEYEICNYYKIGNNFYYYNATGKYCSLVCLLKNDADKSEIIKLLLDKFNETDRKEIITMLTATYSSKLMDSIFKAQTDIYKEISYRKNIPDFNDKQDKQVRMFEFKKNQNIKLTEEEETELKRIEPKIKNIEPVDPETTKFATLLVEENPIHKKQGEKECAECHAFVGHRAVKCKYCDSDKFL